MTLEELKALKDDLWKWSWQIRSYGRHTEKVKYWEASREITAEEFFAVMDAIEEHNLVCTVRNAEMGFGVALDIFIPQSYPGTPPVHVFVITNHHFGERARFEDGWKEFFPLVSTEENQRKMAFCGFEPLRDKGYYDY